MDGMMMEEQPGASDNRMSLTPSDFGIEAWEDGETYTFTNVKVRQISPGEYEVIAATPLGGGEGGESGVSEVGKGDAEAASDVQETQEAVAAVEEPENYPNPAIGRMMRRR